DVQCCCDRGEGWARPGKYPEPDVGEMQESPRGRDLPLPEWPTFPPAHLFAHFRPTRSSGCWRATGTTWRRNTTKATARISHQPIWPGEISRASICVESRWTVLCS